LFQLYLYNLTVIKQLSSSKFKWQEQVFPCVIGRNSFALPDNKFEGDGKTPCGIFSLIAVYYRADKISLPSINLPLFPISIGDLWSDDPSDPLYNTYIQNGYNLNNNQSNKFSYEKLWREDNMYDIVISTSYNHNPVISGMGSAIFIHPWKSPEQTTAGCLATSIENILTILHTANLNTTWDTTLK
jgi:L,D-peptidoglycan transpeptidase YkuD (ErfK/YbiS/YcfS/YnhG family)